MQKKVLMLLNAPYPADIRVKKESSALLAAGFEVHLLCLRQSNQPRKETWEGIAIHRIDAGKNNYQLAFWDVVMATFFFHPRFRSAAKTLISLENIRLVHVHDLPLAGTATLLKLSSPIQVVVDLHENYPEALRTWFKWKKNPLVRLKNLLFMNPKRWHKIERRACEGADVIIAVVEEMKDRLIKDHGVPPDKIWVVTNTEDCEFIKQPLDPNTYSGLEGKFVVTYCGGIGPHRGVDVAIQAMSLLKNYENIQLVIVGFGSTSVMNNLSRMVNDLDLQNVHFYGFQPFSKFYSYMHLASVNIIPHQSNDHTDNTVPHKLFQGMMAGKPLLVSSSAPLKRLVESYHCGLVFKAGDAKDLAEKLVDLSTHLPLATQLGMNGREATLKNGLNWEVTQKELVRLYHLLVQNG